MDRPAFGDSTLLDGETAFVTGASAGLGQRFATVLAQAGAKVAMGARRTDRLDDLAAGIRAQGGAAGAFKLDVTDAASVRDAVAAAEEAFGPVTLLVNNAGIAVDKSFLDHDEADFDAVVDTSLKGSWLMTQAVARRLVALDRPGNIVNIGSIYGHRTAMNAASYCAAKAGALHLTRVLALELARHRIRVNCLSPGLFKTEMTENIFASGFADGMIKRTLMRRVGDPADLDGPLLMLASDASRFMTGSVVNVDGGILHGAL